MTEPNDIQRSSADEEWSKILGQTSAFLGHVQTLAQREANEPAPQNDEPALAPSTQEDDDTAFVAVFVRSLNTIAIAFHVEGRALSRARAAYGDLNGARLRVLSLSSLEPEIVVETPVQLPGKAELEVELPRRSAFVLVSVGVLDKYENFHSVAHAAPLAISPAVMYPKDPTPPVFFDLQTSHLTTSASPIVLTPDDSKEEPNLSSWVG